MQSLHHVVIDRWERNLNVVPLHGGAQEEPEAKRNKRRQSNRESAHRSRLRKQAEVADAFIRAHSLAQENSGLRCSLSMMRVAVEQLVHDKGVLIDAVGEAGGTVSCDSLFV